MKNILFITKDALNRSYLPTYGNKLWKTPNIDELAQKGTVFMAHHTGAPSTMMSNMCMFTSMNSYESELKEYNFSKIRYKGNTLWNDFEKKGYECHIIWDEAWDSQFRMRDRYFCYGENTQIHSIPNIRQGVGAHHKHEGFFVLDLSKFDKVAGVLNNEIKKIISSATKPVFLWLHIPHVINGYTGFGSDIEAFDRIIGNCRTFFEDDSIFISADHGNMNAEKGKFSYGHDVYEPSALIPLITPRLNNTAIVSQTTTNVDIKSIMLEGIIPNHKFIYCDSAFYMQPNRKIAIYYKNYKYIYNKATKTEELYDLSFDPREDCNLIDDYFFDPNRNDIAPIRELYYYPKWDELVNIRLILRKEKDRIWKTGTMQQEGLAKLKKIILKHNKIKNIALWCQKRFVK